MCVSDRELRLARADAELEQRVGPAVGARVDRDERLRARGVLADGAGCGAVVSTAPDRLVAAGCSAGGLHVSGLGGDGAARGVLERQRDVDLLLARPEPRGARKDRDADGDEQSDDDPGGQRAERSRTVQGV